MASTFGEYLKGIEGNPESPTKTGSFGDYLKNNEATINDSMAQSPTTGTLGTYGQMLGQAVKGIPASVASMVEGSTPYTENNFLDKIKSDDQASQQEFVNRPGRDAPALGGLANQGEIREAAPSLSGSMVSMAPMLAGAGIGGAIGGPVGALAGGVIGTGLGLYGMYRQGENQFVKQAIDQENANRANQSLPPLTQQEAIAKQDQINASGDTAKSGLAQSLPEMVGNAAELGIAMTPIGKAGGIVSKLIPKNVLGRAAAVGGAKLAAVMGTELGEEEITRRFQNPISERNNLPTQSFEDIAKPTLIATAPFGALAGGAGIYHGIKGPMDNAASVAPVVEPTQPEATVEPPKTAATTETPASNTAASVEVNPAAVEPSNTAIANTEKPIGKFNQALADAEREKIRERNAQKRNELSKINRDNYSEQENRFLRDEILHRQNSFEGAIQNLNKRNAERPNTITPASPGTDNQRTEPSAGKTGTEIPGTQEGSEVTQGATDKKLTGENDGQFAERDQGATNPSISAADATNINAGLTEIDGADNGAAIPSTVNADGGVDGDSDSSNGRGLSGDVRGGINGTGGISDSALGDNGAIDQNSVLRTGVELPNELTSPVKAAQQPQQKIKDEKAIKETPNAGQERLLNSGATENGAFSKIKSFKTAKGSVYTVLPNGKTQRFKTAKNENNEPQDLTVFAKFKDIQQEQDFLYGIQQRKLSGTKVYVIDKNGNKYDYNHDVIGKDVRLALVDSKTNNVIDTVDTSIEPKIGYNTFDQRRYLKDGVPMRETHIGNKVTEINFHEIDKNDTQKTTNPTPQAESEQPVTGTDTTRTDAIDQKEETKPAVKSAKPYKLSTGKALFREAVADKLLSKLEKSDNTAGKYYKDEVSKGVFQLIPKTANSKPIEIDGTKPQEQDEATTIPKQPITPEAKQSNEQMAIPTNSNDTVAQSGKAEDDEIGRGGNVDVKEAQQAEATPETETSKQKVVVNDATDKPIPKKDKDLLTSEEIEARLQSIHKQIQALDDISKPRNMDAYNKKYKNLVDRREELSTRINKIKRESKLDENAKTKPVQPEPATDTGGTPPADVDSTGGQEVLGEEAVNQILTTPKARYIQKSKADYAKEHKNATTEQRIKAFKAIEGSYDSELEKAEAALPIEKFKALERNKGIPEGLVKQAYDGLREEYGIMDNASKPLAQIPENQSEPELKQEDTVAQKVAESNETSVASENKESDNSTLSIFTQMEDAKKLPRKEVIVAEKSAQERMDASPMADRLNYIHKNYYSLVQELIDRKDDPVKLTNCKTL